MPGSHSDKHFEKKRANHSGGLIEGVFSAVLQKTPWELKSWFWEKETTPTLFVLLRFMLSTDWHRERKDQEGKWGFEVPLPYCKDLQGSNALRKAFGLEKLGNKDLGVVRVSASSERMKVGSESWDRRGWCSCWGRSPSEARMCGRVRRTKLRHKMERSCTDFQW